MVTGGPEATGGRRSTPREHRVGIPTLLFGFLGSAITWIVHFNLVYFLNTLFCTAGWRGGDLVVFLSAVPFAAISAASGIVAHRRRRALRGAATWEAGLADSGGRSGALLMMGVAGSVLFTLLIVLESLAPIYVPPCAEYRT
ncbi:MAG TPA: hypothetical protein VF158_08265 [Longimicrobiales bacterium]